MLVCCGGTFYYPGRVIFWDAISKTATVEMWRGIQNDLAGKILENIQAQLIVDGLWKDQKGRRQIQVRFYLNSYC